MWSEKDLPAARGRRVIIVVEDVDVYWWAKNWQQLHTLHGSQVLIKFTLGKNNIYFSKYEVGGSDWV